MKEPSVRGRRCHLDDCTGKAVYVAQLDWTAQPGVLLCVGCAADERRWGSVVRIANTGSAQVTDGDR